MVQLEDNQIDQERLDDKINLILKVNYVSSILAIMFGALSYFVLGITEILPIAFIGFAVCNLINTRLLKTHKNASLTYNISSVLALITAFVITLYSGGINSAFIFMLALIVFAGFVSTKKYGEMYLILVFFLVLLIFSQSFDAYKITYNVVPQSAQHIFSLLSVLFSLFLLGNIFGKTLLRTHHALYSTKKQLSAQMEDRETLIKEVYHRIKNNLQTVSSLLNMQARNVEEVHIKNMLKSTQNRVICMAMVHEMLYMRNDITQIEYKPYVKTLSEHLIKSIKGQHSKVKLVLDVEDIKLGADTAITLGLLINEVITNALKYGFTDEEGELSIALKQLGEKNYILHIGDNGIGVAEDMNHETTKSLGLTLIYNLTRQLRGTIEKDNSKKGTNYIITFQEVNQQLVPEI